MLEQTVLHGVSESTGQKLGRLIEAAHEFANFMKHADKDPAAVLDKFTETDADPILFVACHDFSRIAKGQPVELQVYEAWWFAITYARVTDAPLRAQSMIRSCISHFPGIRRADRAKRLALGLKAIEEAQLDEGLIMEIERGSNFRWVISETIHGRRPFVCPLRHPRSAVARCCCSAACAAL
jgi:hypothetical protein